MENFHTAEEMPRIRRCTYYKTDESCKLCPRYYPTSECLRRAFKDEYGHMYIQQKNDEEEEIMNNYE